MPSEFDEARFPLLTIAAIGENTDADVDARLAFLGRHLDAGRRFVVVFDTSGSYTLSATQRRRWSTWLHANDDRIRASVIGCAAVVTSAAVRGVFTSVFWLWRPPMPTVIVGTRSEADAWALGRLAAN